MTRKLTQFDWRRLWRRKVEPHLGDPLVQAALDLGMKLLDPCWRRGDPPHRLGAIGFTPAGRPRRVVEGKLSWYRPLARCHWIVFFSFVLGRLIYTRLRWDIVTGDLHTVAVGFDEAGDPAVVMDILLFDQFTAAESLEQTRKRLAGCGPTNMDDLYRLFVTSLETDAVDGRPGKHRRTTKPSHPMPTTVEIRALKESSATLC